MDKKKRLQEKLAGQIDYSREYTDQEIQELIDEVLLQERRQTALSLKECERLRKELFHTFRKLDVLQELIEDTSITEIMINGWETIFVEKNGKLL